MYYIATINDKELLRNSYTICDQYCQDMQNFSMPELSDEQLMNYINNQQILISDLGEDNYAANVCFEINNDHILIIWSVADDRHPGDIDAILSYLMFNYKLPLRYWLIANTQVEQDTIKNNDFIIEHTLYLDSKIDNFGIQWNLYEFALPELKLFQ